ncbi:MAG: farnesyl diphosphate synthase [Pseudomonadota bacterium]|nr:farnesyl diphosphate synthase [Pseudomonadota bacterium]
MVLNEIVTPLQERSDQFLSEILPDSESQDSSLAQAMRYAVLSPGKRIRPILTYVTGQALGATIEQLDQAAAAVEIIHAYSLIHDDLPAMDDDDLRRGRPTCHRKFDEATAILAGDALQSLAFEVLVRESEPLISPDILVKMVRLLANASGIKGMAGGQAVDLAATGTMMDEARMKSMHLLKTGALIKASVMLGYYVSQSNNLIIESALENYARCIGLAFQVQDDILDVEGDTATIGKPQGSDDNSNKATYPKVLGLIEAKEKAHELVSSAINSLEKLNRKADPLRLIAEYIIQRKK